MEDPKLYTNTVLYGDNVMAPFGYTISSGNRFLLRQNFFIP